MSVSSTAIDDRQAICGARRVVVKVGSATVAGDNATGAGGIETDTISRLASQLDQLVTAGLEVVLVSSGAIAAGCARLGWHERPDTVHQLQAAAAVGQMALAQGYEQSLAKLGRNTAMILLTHADFADRQRYLNARATLNELLSLGVLPIINENDTVATEEIRFGDNDTLAAQVANLLVADLLIILTDVDGLRAGDPRHTPDAPRISSRLASDTSLDQMVGEGAGRLGRGGMVTKLQAARLAARSGAHTVIAKGDQDDVLAEIVRGADVGTWLQPELTPITARKRWIAGQLRAKGDLVLDDGACRVLSAGGASLLAVGVVQVRGVFRRGDVVRMISADGIPIAQGLSNYASDDAQRLVGVKSEAFAQHISYVAEPELVHRDNLVLV